MKTPKNFLFYLVLILAINLSSACNSAIKSEDGTITFYKVPLVCGAAPEIGCGSRIKPLFIDTEKEKEINESWTNRKGTVIAIKWTGTPNEELIQSLFEKHEIEADIIANKEKKEELLASFNGADKWYKGMDVDQLSIEEAGVIATDLTKIAVDSGLISSEESSTIRDELEAYFKRELVIVRTNDELGSSETQDRWRQDGYNIYVKHVGKEKADQVAALYLGTFNTDDCDTEECCDEKEDCAKEK